MFWGGWEMPWGLPGGPGRSWGWEVSSGVWLRMEWVRRLCPGPVPFPGVPTEPLGPRATPASGSTPVQLDPDRAEAPLPPETRGRAGLTAPVRQVSTTSSGGTSC